MSVLNIYFASFSEFGHISTNKINIDDNLMPKSNSYLLFLRDYSNYSYLTVANCTLWVVTLT